MTNENHDFLRRLNEGDEDAWREIYPTLRKSAMGILVAMNLPKEDAEEIAHDAVLEAVRCDSYNNLLSTDELKKFVLYIAKLRGLDWFNKGKTQKRGSGMVDSFEEEIGENGQTRGDKISAPQKGMDPNEKIDILPALRGCLEKQLSEKDSFLIRKFFLEGWTQSEIAEKFGFKFKGIGTTIKRALEKLERCLGSKGIHNPFS